MKCDQETGLSNIGLVKNLLCTSKKAALFSQQIITTFLLFELFVCHFAYAAFAYTASVDEIKAAYIYQFIKYIEWPTQNAPQTEVVLCLLGAPHLYPLLSQKIGSLVQGKRLVIKQANSLEEVGTVHMLFVGQNVTGEEKIISTFNSRGVLTVGESSGFAEKGGMINFVHQGDHVIFEINLEEAKRQGVIISSKLLQLAIIVSTSR